MSLSLLQLPDSHVVLRIKFAGNEGYRNVPMLKKDADKLQFALADLNYNTLLLDSALEQKTLKNMVGDSVSYRLINYNSLHFPSYLKPLSQNNLNRTPASGNLFSFLNAGV